jgi:signal transduction histidine kinase
MHAAPRFALMADEYFERRSAVFEREAMTPRTQDELAHDLNNALTAVIASLEPLEKLLARMTLSDAAAKRAHDYAQAALHGAELASVLSREMRGDRRGVPEDMLLDTALDVATSMVVSSAGEATSIVSLARPGVRVRAFGPDLVSVFVNLLKNAVEATDPARSNYIVIRTRSSERDIDVLISDTGVGMSRELVARVLGGSCSTKDGAARGLGLRIVKRVLEHVGGALTIESEVGGGTTMRVTLPLAASDEAEW